LQRSTKETTVDSFYLAHILPGLDSRGSTGNTKTLYKANYQLTQSNEWGFALQDQHDFVQKSLDLVFKRESLQDEIVC
jgi:hypothetical protein